MQKDKKPPKDNRAFESTGLNHGDNKALRHYKITLATNNTKLLDLFNSASVAATI